MKIVGFMYLHYGVDYMAHAIRSIIGVCDVFHVMYVPLPERQIYLENPDTEEMIFSIAKSVCGDRFVWHRMTDRLEKDVKPKIYDFEPDADVIIYSDCDEVWPPGLPEFAIAYANAKGVKRWQIPFTNYWRSFRRKMTHTPRPIRLIYPKCEESTIEIPTHQTIGHFSYAMPERITYYKRHATRHYNDHPQARPFDYWWKKWHENDEYNVHPTLPFVDVVDCEPPEYMKDHPFYDLEVIR